MTKTIIDRAVGRVARNILEPPGVGIFDQGYRSSVVKGERRKLNYQKFLEPGMDDETAYRAFRSYMEAMGLDVRDVASEDEIPGRHSAARYDNTAFVAQSYRGRKLSPVERMVRLAHEYGAGHDHEESDERAQREAIRVFREEFLHPRAAALAEFDLEKMMRGYSQN